jgi:1,4-alpha-glucan branching enzyme
MADKSTRVKTSDKSTGTKVAAKSAKTKAQGAPSKGKAAAKLHAPEANQVFVAGCFNNWDPTADPLTQVEGGTWTCTLMLEPGEHEYRFVVDGEWWDDPMAAERRANEFGCENCLIIV